MSLAIDLLLAGINGITWGIIIALIALGLNFIFGLLEIVNLAHGSLYMAGAVIAWFVVQFTGSFLIALLVAPLIVALIGVAIERFLLRPIKTDLSMTLIVTFGLLLIFQQVSLLTFGPGTKSIATPIPQVVSIGPVTYPLYRFAVAILALSVMGGLHLFLQRTRHGMWMRGVRQDPEMAEALGIHTDWIYALTFGLGAFFAAFAGVLAAPIVSINHLMGLEVLAIAFIVIVVGGLGSLRGVLVASLLFSLIDNIGTVFVTSVRATILAFVVLGAILVVRPEGIFSGGTVLDRDRLAGLLDGLFRRGDAS